MKAVVKWTAVAVGSILLLAFLAWTGTFFYWHFRIQGAIQVLENRPTPQARDAAVGDLLKGGCRTLPYLVAALDPAREDDELLAMTALVFGWTGSQSGMSRDLDTEFQRDLESLNDAWQSQDGTAEMRRQGCDQVRKWWAESGSRYHSWWRVWCSSCRWGSW